MSMDLNIVRNLLKGAVPGSRFAIIFDHGGFAQARFFSALAGPKSLNIVVPEHIMKQVDACVGLREWFGRLHGRTVVMTIGPEFDASSFLNGVAPGLESMTKI